MGMDYFGADLRSDTENIASSASARCVAGTVPHRVDEKGYTVMVTGDHGINATVPWMAHSRNAQRALFIIRPGIQGAGDTGETSLTCRSHRRVHPVGHFKSFQQ